MEGEEDVGRGGGGVGVGKGIGWLPTVGPSAKVLSLVGGCQHKGSMRNGRVYNLPT